MSMEDDIFKKAKVDYSKLCAYGFCKKKDFYQYSKNIMKDSFQVTITIDRQGKIKGQIIDLSFGDEYTFFRVENSSGSYAGKVREEYRMILEDIRNECFTSSYFIFNQSNRISQFIEKTFGDKPEFEWEKFPDFAVYRNNESKKWYGLIMNISQSKLIQSMKGEVEILNLKLDPKEIEKLLNREGFYPAYHMNKKNWITIILNDTISDEEIIRLVKESYSYTVVNKSLRNKR